MKSIACFVLLTTPVWAADSSSGLAAEPIIATFVYGLIGLVLYVIGYFLFDKVMKLDLRKELVVDQNTSIGVMMAGVFIGIGIIIAAAMK